MNKALQISTFVIVMSATLAVALPCFADELAPMALNGFAFAPKQLRTAVVADQDGKAVGIVEKVVDDRSGKPLALEVMLSSGREHYIPASEASYDPISNRVVTDDVGTVTADARPVGVAGHP